MRITEDSVQKIRDSSITQVVSSYLQLDRHGKARCPFHDEKSASFKVTEAKGMFKCFGCGQGGDVIEFVRTMDKLDFIEAVQKIATITGENLEYEEIQDEEQYVQQKAEKDRLKETLRLATETYRKNLWDLPDSDPVLTYLQDRQVTRDDISDWQIGWSGTQWKLLTGPFIQKGLYELSSKLGLIRRSASGDSNFDGYRSRLTLPIANQKGEVVGLAGRWFELDPADAGKNYPKYINPPENEIYHKSQVLFGLSRAQKAISKNGKVFLVEGYFDVIAMHKNGNQNTVASCGTALTSQQVSLLKRFTDHVVVLRDGDAAGIKAAHRDIPILLKNDFKVDIALLPIDQDPDKFIQSLPAEQKGHGIDSLLTITDGFLWLVSALIDPFVDDNFRLGNSKGQVLELLSKFPNAFARETYLASLIKKYKWPRSDTQKQLSLLIDQQKKTEHEPDDTHVGKMPKWMDQGEFMKNGFCTVNDGKRTGYYTFNSSGQVEITNFIITPLFHDYAGKDSRHLIQIDNGYHKAVLDIESSALVSIDLLQKYVVSEGAFIIYGQKMQMLRIANTLLNNFTKCIRIKFLGWHESGFFAFVDVIYVPGQGLINLDQWGIAKHKEKNYLVPAASAAYKELQKTDEDPFESDRVLTHINSQITFSFWGALMKRVYADKGVVAIAYVILTIFRDIVFNIDNNCPHLYAYGERSSGKSKWAESIAAVFFHNRSAFNLNSGTDYAFFLYMQRFKNCPALLNEFDEKVIKPEWFQVLKGAFDGEGRQKGIMGTKNQTEIMKINSTLVLMGQFIVTMDDNSIISRSIIEGFNEVNRSDEDKAKYNELKSLEEKGMSSLVCEILQYREEFKVRYRDRFNEILSQWRENTNTDAKEFNQRIMQNWCHLYTCYDLISKHIQLPETNGTFERYCEKNGLQWSRFLRSSDILSEFWGTFAFLVNQGIVEEGWDFRIETVIQVRIRDSGDTESERTLSFTEPKKVLFLRMKLFHKHYELSYKNRTGKPAMTLQNLYHYMRSRKYYIGASKQNRFKRSVSEYSKKPEETITSSDVFFLDQLDLDIENNLDLEGGDISNAPL